MFANLVRDVTKVHPMTKSEAKRRLLEWEAAIRKDERERVKKMLGQVWDLAHEIANEPDDWKYAIDTALSRLNEMK